MRFLFGTLPFMAEKDDDLERLAQRARRATHDDHWLRVPSRSQELGDYISSGHQATSYNKSDRRSSATTDRDSIDDYSIIRVSP
jgi:hypothetical protein